MEFPDVAKVERLSLRPGDRLVLTVDHQLDEEEFGQLAKRMNAWLRSAGVPEAEGRVLILEAGVSLQVLEAGT
jgi:hypothetical protein